MTAIHLGTPAATPERRMTVFGAIAIWIGLELAVGAFAVGAVWNYLDPFGAPVEAGQGIIATEEPSSPWRV